MTRTRVRRRRLVAGLAVIAVVGVLAGGQAASALGDQSGGPVSIRHVVRPGETLWSIAQRAAPGRDPRDLARSIEEANQVTAGDLVPGRSLVILLDA